MTVETVTTPTKVMASVLHGIKDLRVESRNLHAPGSTEVQVEVQTTGLCGSDLHYYNHYRNGDILVREPLTLGHESAGVVTAVGSDVKSDVLRVGDRVALEVGVPCNECELCLTGRYNICKTLRFRSSAKLFPHFQGTLQQRINHPAAYCHRLPPSVSQDLGALLEPLGVAIHATRRARLQPSSTVLIFGAGAVGLLCAAVCRYEGAQRIVIADIQAERVDFAVRHGFADDGVVVPMKRPVEIDDKLAFAREVAASVKTCVGGAGGSDGEVDAVFECTGVESCLQTAIYSTKPGGRIMLIGMGNPIQTLPISTAALREVDLVGVFRYAETYAEAISMVSTLSTSDGDRDSTSESETATSNARGKLPDLRKLITQRFRGFAAIPDAFAMAGRVKEAEGNLVLKVVVEL